MTQADLASQEAVRQTVLGAFPQHALLGEEKGPNEPAMARTEYRWIVDPLDGTTNFVHGVPHYSVSLALERNGELLVGAVYDPMLEECFAAAAGPGGRLNGRPIHASQVADAVRSPGRCAASRPASGRFARLAAVSENDRPTQGIRRTGSSALNLCYLAAGRFDLYWSYSTNIWDVAAGVLILREAGGRVTSPTGGDFRLEEAHFLAAANQELHVQLRDIAATITSG